MKLPNGFGSIVRYGGNRRKPYIVRKNGKVLASFATQEEALAYLVEYNKDPSIFSPSSITFAEVFQLMSAEKFPKLAKSTIANYKAVYKYCTELYSVPFAKLRLRDLQAVVHKLHIAGIGYASQKKLRQLFHGMYTYAIKYEIVRTDAAQYVEIDQHKPVYKKSPFNTRQLNRIRKLADNGNPWAMAVVMLCYCGCRPSEFISVLKRDVKLKQRYFVVRDSKTDAGRNRAVPISRKVLGYYEYWMQQSGKTLIADAEGNPLTYHKFRSLFDKVMTATRCKHTPHECRHTCATWLDDKGANDVATKKILGHAVQGITKGVYTHKDLRQLKKAIDLL
ncbi:tyrosine-type recombinase/integrase [Phascolarctobacterium sp.]|uniref:tyrosine-type recombinase/integrase n=1 Tax=Phascolarctobacterium sp. TaxID=2049039 RepID=UPI003865E7F9